MTKEILLGIIERMEFLESYEVKEKCPKCGGEVIRHIRKEPQQKWGYRWYVEYCSNPNCDYLNTGFTPKDYKPKKSKRFKIE